MRTGILVLLVASTVVTSERIAAAPRDAAAQGAPSLATASRLACTFNFYTVTVWADGVPEVRTGDDTLTFEIDTIDRDAHTARIVTTSAAVRVSAFLTETGLTVIEQTPIGNFMVTTVFASGAVDGARPAVHSRHFGDVITPPNPSQYFGACRALGPS